MKKTVLKNIFCFLLILSSLFPIQSFCGEKNFIVRVTGYNPTDQISFSGNIMQMTPSGFMPIEISQATPFDQALKTSFVSVKLHATSFWPSKIRVEIIERTKNEDKLLIAGMGYRVFVQAGANGVVFVSSH